MEMLSDTLTAGLKRYEIGSKLRALRVKKKLGLVQLGEHTGLSAALLSKIERGNLFPTLPTLLRIAMVFGVGLEHFFIESEDRPLVAVTRKKDRLRLPNQPAAEAPSYFFESPPPLQCPIVFRPVLDPVARPWDLVAARLIELVGHRASSRRGSGPISLRRRPAQARERHFCTCIPEEHGMGKLTVRAGLPGATIFAPVPRAPALDLCPG